MDVKCANPRSPPCPGAPAGVDPCDVRRPGSATRRYSAGTSVSFLYGIQRSGPDWPDAGAAVLSGCGPGDQGGSEILALAAAQDRDGHPPADRQLVHLGDQ